MWKCPVIGEPFLKHPEDVQVQFRYALVCDAEGITILKRRLQNPSLKTRATLTWSLSMDATPKAVLTSVGQREQRATVIAEAKKDGVNNHDQ